jgi:lipopolysaccharide export system ATP-binding protein
VLKILSFGSRRTREEPHAEPAFPDQQYGDLGYADPGYPEQHYLEQQQPYPGEPYADQGGDPYPPQQWHNGHPQPGTALELAGGIGEEPLDAEGWLAVHHVKKSYKKRMVVRGVSLAVARGESVGLLGPNGAGKTTVFYMITGLVPADEGAISIDGADVTRLPMYRRARLGIGYLPQEASIFRGLTVEQNIMAVLEIVESSAKQRRIKLDSLLDEFRITHLRKSPSIALSGGERRRCEIARALASGPSFMLLDEPFAGIDPIAVGDIQELVRHLTERGIGVLITDHNVRETLSLIDRAYIIYDGQVLTQGKPEEIIANDDVRRVYLGDMFVNAR